MTTLPTIFVSIASYRDPECQWTLQNLFESAEHPQRVFVGLFWQAILPDDEHCFQNLPRHARQVRAVRTDARKSRGACWAKSMANRLYQGQDYILLIDSHMRFAKNWDSELIDMLHGIDAAKPLLSTYPAAYTPSDERQHYLSHLVAREFDQRTGILHLQGRIMEFNAPRRTPFVAGGYVFAPAKLFEEVPLDPYLYFYGEEITFAIRAYTHGWDGFSPHQCLIYHYYGRQNQHKHWSDHPDWANLEQLSVQRVQHLLGVTPSQDPLVIQELDTLYGLGDVRSLDDYQRFSGIDFAKREIKDFAIIGEFELIHNTDQS